MRQGLIQCALLAFRNTREQIHDPRLVLDRHLREEPPAFLGEFDQVYTPIGGAFPPGDDTPGHRFTDAAELLRLSLPQDVSGYSGPPALPVILPVATSRATARVNPMTPCFAAQ